MRNHCSDSTGNMIIVMSVHCDSGQEYKDEATSSSVNNDVIF